MGIINIVGIRLSYTGIIIPYGSKYFIFSHFSNEEINSSILLKRGILVLLVYKT